ncbi:hypothetical protein [Paraburkholderia sp. BCC1885]|uniref:hypothetical protein n=1 Tax=Paraburkholderia sp. BCC1885 TaxID=2562669 RepID=UPI0011834472|nr:hypothetical protein [Paraburkholderia sp. BCC1885]
MREQIATWRDMGRSARLGESGGHAAILGGQLVDDQLHNSAAQASSSIERQREMALNECAAI